MSVMKRMGIVSVSGCLAVGMSAWVTGDASPAESRMAEDDQTTLQADEAPKPSRSSTIALTSNDRYLVVVNRQNNSVSVIEVWDEKGNDIERLITEISVGKEPRYVAISPDDRRAFVTNAGDGTVSVIDLSADPQSYGDSPPEVVQVGTEPRGIAITPNGTLALVANHTSRTVSVIDAQSLNVTQTVPTGGNPQAIAITDDGDQEDTDERVYVTQFFGELIDPQRPDGFDDAKQGVVDTFNVGNWAKVDSITLPPLDDSGFTADRRQFCLNTRQILQANGEVVFFNSSADGMGNGAEQLANEVFCPDPTSVDASPEGPIGSAPQGVYSNFLYAALIRGDKLYIPHVGVAPEPPVRFDVNVQALVGVIDTKAGALGAYDHTINLNTQIATETAPDNPTESLDRLFGNDLVAIDADRQGQQFFIVSRGGNYVLRAELDETGMLDIGAPDSVVRLQTGNMPSGVVVNSTATRAYTNNEVNTSVTSIDLSSYRVLSRDISSSTPPEPGTPEHRVLAGKLLFFTALGIPDVLDRDADGAFDIPIRDIVPLQFRNKASNSGWSSCSSCHEDGHADGVTWVFPTGPRQTIPLEGSFTKGDLNDQRIMNWNAVRGSPATDFDQNSRGVQGGMGHATNVNGENRTAQIFNHGPVVGVSDALDAMHEWIATVRAPMMPDAADPMKGRTVFATYCASCHGGTKWTKSRTAPLYQNNPTFAEDPIGANFFNGVPPIDSRLTVAGPQIVSVTDDGAGTLTFLENVGTFDPNNVLEIRGAGAIAGQSTQGFPALTAEGAFNVPSLLGVGLSAPYLHAGIAETLEEVFAVHRLEDATIEQALSAEDRADLMELLNAIDDETETFESETDAFLQTLGP